MREQLQWFERRPLFGRRIVVTRSRSNVGRLALELRELGAEVIEFPTIETVEPDDYGALDRAVAELAGFDWLIFTSGQAVQRFIGRLSKLGHDVRELAGASLAAIGPATAAALRNHGLSVATVPSEFRAEAIVDAIGPNNIKGAAFLIPRAQVARETIIELLILNGARRVEAVAVYKTVKPSAARVGRIRQLLANDAVDIVVFTSSSTVTNFCSLVGSLPGEQKAAAIGTVTADTARKHGFDVVVTPVEYTIDGLITATCGYFGSRQ